jgi:hypothetical protein
MVDIDDIIAISIHFAGDSCFPGLNPTVGREWRYCIGSSYMYRTSDYFSPDTL